MASLEGDVPGEAGRLLAAARGDGAIDVFDFGLENANSKKSSHPAASKRTKASISSATSTDVKRVVDTKSPSDLDALVPGRKRHLHFGIGGHVSSVNHVYVTTHPLNFEKHFHFLGRFLSLKELQIMKT